MRLVCWDMMFPDVPHSSADKGGMTRNDNTSDEKPEEYRDDTPYYESRFDKYIGKPVQVIFRNGYRKNSPSFIKTVIPRYGTGRLKWGADPRKRYIVLAIQKEADPTRKT
jgi:hypothetical protein